MSRRLVIAGATGSIGKQAIDVLGSIPDLEVVGLSAGSNVESLLELATDTGVEQLAIASARAGALASVPKGHQLSVGADAPAAMVSELQPDLVLNAAVGFAGLAVSVAALESGADLALANKESLVAGGELVTALAEANGVSIIPVDSEHASLAQLIAEIPPESVESVTLTASGGPFRGRSSADLEQVTVEQALAHPTWSMGGKITIDSATMMNKGLEVIEARHLFGIGYDRIRVVVHPQSIVHALASLVDGMVLAHLGHPDMRAPIAWALAHPERPRLETKRLDLASVGRLDFEPPDEIAFPALRLAREAGIAAGTAPAVLNAANEVAVAGFLEGRIPFSAIPRIVEATLGGLDTGTIHSLASVQAADDAARQWASAETARLSR